ncbi:unnamed protein product [Cyclocybe aegerita]|uniref:Uncharacterized protein n=1 Tax=Cyclocybe aegerita TaxID=1973307 RepID=A0A8S0VZF3_CYCAE|nr:unnamed protein product [Cyclocybe aegerita]
MIHIPTYLILSALLAAPTIAAPFEVDGHQQHPHGAVGSHEHLAGCDDFSAAPRRLQPSRTRQARELEDNESLFVRDPKKPGSSPKPNPRPTSVPRPITSPRPTTAPRRRKRETEEEDGLFVRLIQVLGDLD